jgi:hypothetical protein
MCEEKERCSGCNAEIVDSEMNGIERACPNFFTMPSTYHDVVFTHPLRQLSLTVLLPEEEK